MMRRIVDGAIPVCAAVGTWPSALGLITLPPALVTFLGPSLAWAWALTIAVSFTSITVGVAISKQHPGAAFFLEAIPFSYVGSVFALHAAALFATNGIGRAWAVAWWEIGIVAYFFARDVELLITLRRLRRAFGAGRRRYEARDTT
jgi:hypothetical protein